MTRIFYLYDLVRIPEIAKGECEKESTGPGRCHIYFECDGQMWRIEERENTDGEDELWQELVDDSKAYGVGIWPSPERSRAKPGEGQKWVATAVKLVEVTVNKYVPI